MTYITDEDLMGQAESFAIDAGAQILADACSNDCVTYLDALKTTEFEKNIEVKDVGELVLESN